MFNFELTAAHVICCHFIHQIQSFFHDVSSLHIDLFHAPIMKLKCPSKQISIRTKKPFIPMRQLYFLAGLGWVTDLRYGVVVTFRVRISFLQDSILVKKSFFWTEFNWVLAMCNYFIECNVYASITSSAKILILLLQIQIFNVCSYPLVFTRATLC